MTDIGAGRRHRAVVRSLASLFAVAVTFSAACSAEQTEQTSHHFTLAVQSDPQSLDPAMATDLPGSVVMVNLYESLVRFEGSPPKMVMHLAESITSSDDGASYTAKLRPNLKFHDGTALDAKAVAYSMDRLLTMKGGRAAPLLSLIDPGNTEVVDDLTVKFTLKQKSAVFPSTLAFFFIVNPTQIEANKLASGPYGANGDYGQQWLSGHDAGSGPYQLTSRTPNAEMQFTAFTDYWNGWKDNQYQTFTIRIASEPASAGLLVRQGVVDAIYENYPTSVFDDLESADNVTVHTDLGLKPFYLFLNNQKAPTNDPRVRQAIAYAFDYESALKLAKGSERLPGPLPSEIWSARTEPAYQTDMAKAKQLMADAGITPGSVTLEFGAIGGPSSIQNRIALILQDNLAELGIKLEISNHAWADILAQTSKADTTKHVYAIQLAPAYPDPDGVLSPAWSTSSHGSWSGAQWYDNPEVDTLIADGRSTLDEGQRKTIYEKIQQDIIEDSPAVFMMNLPIQVAISDKVGGYHFDVQYYNYQVYQLFANS